MTDLATVTTVLMAGACPRSRLVGVDVHEAAIEQERRRAAGLTHAERVTAAPVHAVVAGRL